MVEQWAFRYIADGPWQQGKPTREHGERGYDLPVTLTYVALGLPAIPFLERTPFPGLEKVPAGQRPQRLIPVCARDTGDDVKIRCVQWTALTRRTKRVESSETGQQLAC